MSYSGARGGKTEQPVILKEDEKIPLFLIKLWNIVEDSAYYDVIRWDETGYSFHILDPYSFCRNVLPQYFKHNNLNSLIRQLNMYGFRKMTPIEKTSLARSESDQDHLEFSHPCFVREHPELLVNIKRKAQNNRQQNSDGTVTISNKDLSAIFEELQSLRERQKEMESKVIDLRKENGMFWQEIGHMRGTHIKQQQIVTKLVQFMVALLQPSGNKRLGKRNIMAIDEIQPKRARVGEESSDIAVSTVQQGNVGEVLDRLMREYGLPSVMRSQNFQNQLLNRRNTNVPIISDVTDELNNLNTAHSTANFPHNFERVPQQSSKQFQYNQANRFNSNLTTQVITDNGEKLPSSSQSRQQLALNAPLVQQSNVMQPSLSQQARSSYSASENTRETIPIVNSPIDHAALPPATPNYEDPIISSPNSGSINFSSNDFANYLDNVGNQINQCRDLIGDHWDDLDLDGLLSSYDDETLISLSEEQQSRHIQQPTTTATSSDKYGRTTASRSNDLSYTSHE